MWFFTECVAGRAGQSEDSSVETSFPSTPQDSGIELRSSGLEANTLSCLLSIRHFWGRCCYLHGIFPPVLLHFYPESLCAKLQTESLVNRKEEA